MNDNDSFYQGISDEFADKYSGSFKGDVIQDEVTQPFWYSMLLESRRMKKLGVEKHIQIKKNPDEKGKIQTTRTAGNKITIINEPVSVRKSYRINGGRKNISTDYCQCSQCVVTEGNREVNEHLCPYCGTIGTGESFIDGCDYCGAKFKVTNLGRKINSYNVFHDYKADIRDKKRIYKILAFAAAMICLLLYFLSFASFGKGDVFTFTAMLSQLTKVIGGFGIGIFASVVYARWRISKEHTERIVENDELRSLESAVENFNREEFVASLDYKLKDIHFADGEDKYSKLYENVLECNLKNCCITGYSADKEYHHITTEVTLDILCLENSKPVTRTEKAYLSMYKTKEEHTSSSIVSYSCDSCGSSVSLLNGGKCTYCGKELELSIYEFDIEKYESQWIISGDKGKKNQEKFLKKTIALVSAVILVLSIPKICGTVYAGIRTIKDEKELVYIAGNDVIPSFQNYGYAILGNKVSKIHGSQYEYRFVNDYENNMKDYADKLVEEDDFEIKENLPDKILLERKERFGFGNIKLTISRNDGQYIITVR